MRHVNFHVIVSGCGKRMKVKDIVNHMRSCECQVENLEALALIDELSTLCKIELKTYEMLADFDMQKLTSLYEEADNTIGRVVECKIVQPYKHIRNRPFHARHPPKDACAGHAKNR